METAPQRFPATLENRLPGPDARSPHNLVPAVRRYSRRRYPRSRNEGRSSRGFGKPRRRVRGDCLSGDSSDAAIPPEVSSLVVRLEPGPDPVRRPYWRLSGVLRDEYPSTDEEQAVHIEIPYPDAKNELNRWLPLVKWFLAIPHYVILLFLGVAVFFCVVIAWFAILITGRYPRSLFDFVVGVFRWWLRVAAYAFLLTTDRYPPFSTGT